MYVCKLTLSNTIHDCRLIKKKVIFTNDSKNTHTQITEYAINTK